MQKLQSLLQQCEDDTRAVLGHVAAQRLGNWRRHLTSQDALVLYVRQLLWGEHCANGRTLDQRGRLSLERIVIDHCADLFSDSDREQAKRTLGIA